MSDINQKASIIEKKTEVAIADATGLKITSEKKRIDASEFLRDVISPLIKEVKQTFDPIVAKARAVADEARAQRKRHLEPLELSRTRVRSELGKWEEVQELKRLEKEAQARLVAAEKAEAQRKEEAEALRESGLEEEAQEAEETPLIIPEPVVKQRAKVDGVSFRTDWVYTIDSERALKEWLWEKHKDMLLIDRTLLRKLVEAMQDGANKIPGLTARAKKVPVTRGR